MAPSLTFPDETSFQDSKHRKASQDQGSEDDVVRKEGDASPWMPHGPDLQFDDTDQSLTDSQRTSPSVTMHVTPYDQ